MTRGTIEKLGQDGRSPHGSGGAAMVGQVSAEAFGGRSKRRPSAAERVAADWHDCEKGMFTFVNLVAVMLCALLVVFLINVGHVTHEKIELQNAADATTYSAALWQARGMNAITATNHVMGEMMSLVIVHHAIGGRRLDHPEMGPADTEREDTELDAAAAAASGLGASIDAYETVRQHDGVVAGKTILEAKKNLKTLLAWVYWTKAAARAMQYSGVPPVVAAGRALEAVMDAFEPLIEIEYKILKALHAVAFALRGHKFVLRDEMLPEAKAYTEAVVEQTPRLAARAARTIADRNSTKGHVFPDVPALPVVLDPFREASGPVFGDDAYVQVPQYSCGCLSVPADNLRSQVVKTTQLARATWPWVNYHREPVLRAMRAFLPLSGAAGIYFDETAGTSKQLLNRYQRSRNRDLGLFVMAGYPAPDKGYALWTDDPLLADNLFTVVGMVHRRPPLVIGERHVFRQAHRNGRVAVAQAMLYNANEQERPKQRIDLTCKRIIPIRQANVGWDTLNWTEGSRQESTPCAANRGGNPSSDYDAMENRPYELVGIGIPPDYPRIRVNWQAKLVPLTRNRLGQAAAAAPSPFRAVLSRLRTELDIFRTH